MPPGALVRCPASEGGDRRSNTRLLHLDPTGQVGVSLGRGVWLCRGRLETGFQLSRILMGMRQPLETRLTRGQATAAEGAAILRQSGVLPPIGEKSASLKRGGE